MSDFTLILSGKKVTGTLTIDKLANNKIFMQVIYTRKPHPGKIVYPNIIKHATKNLFIGTGRATFNKVYTRGLRNQYCLMIPPNLHTFGMLEYSRTKMRVDKHKFYAIFKKDSNSFFGYNFTSMINGKDYINSAWMP